MSATDTRHDEPFDEDDLDALSVLQMDAFERQRDHAATAKAFGAIEALTAVFQEVSEGRSKLMDSPILVENIRRLAHIMEDYYAAHPQD